MYIICLYYIYIICIYIHIYYIHIRIPGGAVGLVEMLIIAITARHQGLCQYLYFCTSKASKLRCCNRAPSRPMLSMRQHTTAYASQHASAYDSMHYKRAPSRPNEPRTCSVFVLLYQ